MIAKFRDEFEAHIEAARERADRAQPADAETPIEAAHAEAPHAEAAA
jgi:hypothetical protein